jgi:hypothetical protein
MRARVVRVAELLKSYDDIFICALADNQADFYDIDMIFVLTLDEPVMRQRLGSREKTDRGKDAGELSDIFWVTGSLRNDCWRPERSRSTPRNQYNLLPIR